MSFAPSIPLSDIPPSVPEQFVELVHAALVPLLYINQDIPEDRRQDVARRLVMVVAVRCNVSGVSQVVEAVLSLAQDSGLSFSRLVARLAHHFATKNEQGWERKVVEAITALLRMVVNDEIAARPIPVSVSRQRAASPPPREYPVPPEQQHNDIAASLERFLDTFQAILRRSQIPVSNAANPSVLVEKPKPVHASRGPNLAPWVEDAGLTQPLSQLPVYLWHADDPDLSIIRTAISALARAVQRITDIGGEAYRRQLSAEFTARGRHVDIRTAAGLQSALSAGGAPAMLALAEVTLLVDPDLPGWAYERVLLARIAPPPTTPDEHRRMATGSANLPIAHALLPAHGDKQRRHEETTSAGSRRQDGSSRRAKTEPRDQKDGRAERPGF